MSNQDWPSTSDFQTDDEDGIHQKKLKQAVHYSVDKICREEREPKDGLNYTRDPLFTTAVTALTYQAIQNWSRDLVAFSGHAGRETIKVEDVLLLARRMPNLEAHLKDFAAPMMEASTALKEENKRKRQKKNKSRESSVVIEEKTEKPENENIGEEMVS